MQIYSTSVLLSIAFRKACRKNFIAQSPNFAFMQHVGYVPLPDWFVKPDKEIFYVINTQGANDFFDWLMPVMRNSFTWAPLYFFIIFFA